MNLTPAIALPLYVSSLTLFFCVTIMTGLTQTRIRRSVRVIAMAGQDWIRRHSKPQTVSLLEQMIVIIPVVLMFVIGDRMYLRVLGGIGLAWIAGRTLYALSSYAKTNDKYQSAVIVLLYGVALLLGAMGAAIAMLCN